MVFKLCCFRFSEDVEPIKVTDLTDQLELDVLQ